MVLDHASVLRHKETVSSAVETGAPRLDFVTWVLHDDVDG